MTDLIPEIKSRIRIDELVNRLGIQRGRKTSKGFFIKSIYKDEKTPSMEICTDSDSFRCFATGHFGDQIQFWQDACGIDFQTAKKELAGIAGITISEEYRMERKRAPIKKKLMELIPKDLPECLSLHERAIFDKEFNQAFGLSLEKEFEITPEFQKKFDVGLQKALLPVKKYRLEINKRIFREFHNYCNNTIGDEPFFNYLVQQRKLHFRKILNHKIFFVIDYQKANNHLKKVFPLADLQRSGLFNENGNLIFFKHRIILSYIHNDQIIYMRGRYFDEKNNANPEDGNKYLGLRNDALNLNKTKRFYNFEIVKELLPGQKIYIVEGELDVIAMETIGFNAIAIPGANNIPDRAQFEKLMAFEIVICGDNDEAGNGLTARLKEIFLSMNKEFSIKKLPTKDVNDFLKAV